MTNMLTSEDNTILYCFTWIASNGVPGTLLLSENSLFIQLWKKILLTHEYLIPFNDK